MALNACSLLFSATSLPGQEQNQSWTLGDFICLFHLKSLFYYCLLPEILPFEDHGLLDPPMLLTNIAPLVREKSGNFDFSSSVATMIKVNQRVFSM